MYGSWIFSELPRPTEGSAIFNGLKPLKMKKTHKYLSGFPSLANPE
jgi:hypothetical protein